MWLRRLLVISLLFFSVSFCYAQEEQPSTLDADATELNLLWPSIWNNLNLLDSNQIYMQNKLAEQENQLQEQFQLTEKWQNAYQEIYLLYQNSEANSEQLSESLMRWKVGCWISIGVSATAITTVVILALTR